MGGGSGGRGRGGAGARPESRAHPVPSPRIERAADRLVPRVPGELDPPRRHREHAAGDYLGDRLGPLQAQRLADEGRLARGGEARGDVDLRSGERLGGALWGRRAGRVRVLRGAGGGGRGGRGGERGKEEGGSCTAPPPPSTPRAGTIGGISRGERVHHCCPYCAARGRGGGVGGRRGGGAAGGAARGGGAPRVVAAPSSQASAPSWRAWAVVRFWPRRLLQLERAPRCAGEGAAGSKTALATPVPSAASSSAPTAAAAAATDRRLPVPRRPCRRVRAVAPRHERREMSSCDETSMV